MGNQAKKKDRQLLAGNSIFMIFCSITSYIFTVKMQYLPYTAPEKIIDNSEKGTIKGKQRIAECQHPTLHYFKSAQSIPTLEHT